MTISRKEEKITPTKNPGPGYYDQKYSMVKTKSKAAVISPSR
jgi:hypothetical protein